MRAQVVEVPTPVVNAERIASLEALSLSLPKGSAPRSWTAVSTRSSGGAPFTGRWQLVLASAVACMAFAF